MKVRLIAVGNRPPEWVSAGFREYARRMPREMPLELVEVAPAARRNLPPERVQEIESERLLAHVGSRDWLVALDERGRTWSTVELAESLENWRMQGRDVTFLIGGADGLHAGCRARADQVVALSALTLPHALVRVVLAEQVYRAWSIIIGHPYHRGA